jgi:hypothetical protein
MSQSRGSEIFQFSKSDVKNSSCIPVRIRISYKIKNKKKEFLQFFFSQIYKKDKKRVLASYIHYT